MSRRAVRCVACGRFVQRLTPDSDWAWCSQHKTLRIDPELRWTFEILGFGAARTVVVP